MHPKVILLKQILSEKSITIEQLSQLAAPEDAAAARKQIEKLLYWTDDDASLAELCLNTLRIENKTMAFVNQLSASYEDETAQLEKSKRLKSFLLDLSEKALQFKPHLIRGNIADNHDPFTSRGDAHYIPLSDTLKLLSLQDQIKAIGRIIRNMAQGEENSGLGYIWYRSPGEAVLFDASGRLIGKHHLSADPEMFDEDSGKFLIFTLSASTEAV